MPATLHVHADPSDLPENLDTLLLVGRRERLLAEDVRALLPESLPVEAWEAMVGGEAKDHGRIATHYTAAGPRKVVAGVLPEKCSRHNAPSRAWAIPGLVRGMGRRGPQGVIFALDGVEHAFASATAAATALPLFSATSKRRERAVHVAFTVPDGAVKAAEAIAVAAEGTRRAASWVDMPPDLLTTTRFVRIAREVAADLVCAIQVIQGGMLRDQGLGGLYGVGRGAKDPPALVVLDHDPVGATRRTCLVGKGIVYDTGGLSLKTKTGMVGMKTDMGGAAAVLGAFEAAVRLGYPERLTAILCIAENMIGPDSIRPDDVLTMLSGKTVEVNNTDAEGRLALGDGVAWAVKYRDPADIVDLATLTGAQPMATGKKHAGIYCNDEGFEQLAVRAGRASGNTVHPLPYAPELYRGEFSSHVADMRNSVKDRYNAQSSCAGQFVGNHLGEFAGRWLHVDLCGPAFSAGRGTGFGVGLLLTLLGVGAPV